MSFFSQQPVGTKPQKITTLAVQTSSYGICMGLAWGTTRVTGNIIWYGDFVATEHTEEMGGKGGGGVTSTNYTYTSAFALGLLETQIADIPRVWAAKEKTTMAALGLDLMSGAPGQSPWSYLQSKHPAEALNYPGLAYVGAAAFDLGGNASLPNLAFEVVTTSAGVGGTPDAAPWVIVADLLAAGGFPAGRLGDLTEYTNWTGANGLFLSPTLTEQKRCAEHLQDVLDMTHTAAVASEGKLKLRTWGDTAASGNGYTFTPSVTPIYDLTDDDFLALDGDLPIRIVRKAQSDAKNRLNIEFKDREKDYATNTAPATDEAHIAEFGERPAETVTCDAIKSASVASTVAYLKLQRGLYVLNTYEFRLGWRYCLLEPMDVVTLTHGLLGMDRTPVRILEVEEDTEGALTITAEDFPQGAGLAPVVPPQPPSGWATDMNAAPGNAATPVVFEPPAALAGAPELWLATSGGANYGGCAVWVSLDDEHYQNVGTLSGKSRHGVLTASMPTSSDPDTTSTVAVDLSVSGGALLAGSQTDRDLYNTLCWVGGELISYQNAALVGINRYNLTSLRRGAYGSAIQAHASGTAFVRCDERIFRYPYDPALVGKTLYIKLQAYNIFGGAYQDLDALTPVAYTVQGAPLGVVSGFALERPWTERDLAVKWTAYPGAASYRIEVWSADGLTQRRSVSGLQETRYVYTFGDNKADGLSRSVQLRLYAISANGQSSAPAMLSATNPQIGAPAGVQIVPAGNAVSVSATKPLDADYAGTRVWIRPSSGFDPAEEAPDYDGADWAYTKMPLVGGTTYYVRMAHYDAFGTDGLTYSTEFPFVALHIGGVRTVTTLPASPADVGGELGIFLDSEDPDQRGIWGWDGTEWKFTRDGANLIANSVAADKIYVANLAAISANMGAITSGSITLSPTGFVRGGQTGYRTGTGFWMGYDGASYKWSYKGTSGAEIAFDGVGFSILDAAGNTILTSGAGVEWTSLNGRPADGDILNSAAGSNANLVPGLVNWTHTGSTNSVNRSAGETEDKTVLIIPASSVLQPSKSPDLVLVPGTPYTVSFYAWQYPGSGRVLHVDLYPDSLPEATVTLTGTPTLYQFTWTPGAAATACNLRFFAEDLPGQSVQCFVGNIKLEKGGLRTPWSPFPGDVVSVANPITNANKGLFGYTGDLNANRTTATSQLIDDAGLAGARIGSNLLRSDGSTAFATDFVAAWNKMTAGNISTYMSGAAIGTAQIQNAAITQALIGSLAVGTAQIQDLSVNGRKISPPTQGSLYVNGGHFGGVWHGLGRYVLLSIIKVEVDLGAVSNPWGGAKVARPGAMLEGQYGNYFDIRNTSEVDLYTIWMTLARTVYVPATITYVYL